MIIQRNWILFLQNIVIDHESRLIYFDFFFSVLIVAKYLKKNFDN